MTPQEILARAVVSAPVVKTKPAPDWSKIGRRSRRKGKKFECEIARLLRDVTGADWQTTRNSGRTDLGGDVYCVDSREFDPVLFECKNRKTFSVRDIILGNTSFAKEMNDVRENWKKRKETMLVVVIRTDLGLFVSGNYEGRASQWSFVHSTTAIITDRQGFGWNFIGNASHFTTSPVVASLFEWIGQAKSSESA